MKVCILTATTAWGGAEIHTIHLAEVLKSRGHEVTVVQLGHKTYERTVWDESKRGKLVYLSISKPLGSISFLESYRILCRLTQDAFIFAKNGLMIASWRFELAARMLSSHYLTIEHMLCETMPPKTSRRYCHGLIPGLGLWWLRIFLSRFMRCLPPRRILCVSEAIRKRLIDEYRFPAGKVSTIYTGVDPEIFRKDDQIRRQVRRAWGIPEKAFVFGSVGRLCRDKGYDLAIECFRQLLGSSPDRDIRLVLVGEGPLKPNLQARVKEAGLDDRVLFPGFIERPWEAYSAFDVFVMPSRTEGLGLALLEAMGCCCFPIAMAVGGIADILRDLTFGTLIPPGDSAGFVTAMKQAVQIGIVKLVEMGRAAREYVVSNFNASVQYRALAEAIERECGVACATTVQAVNG